ncbi:MAG TPA: DUF1501 domain-containing protein [Candidatus Sulfopaludibacter sp.]|jgi:uncharacterized protein (DUF1501 family)|nr:DUF1501 domain-containing protein [Candidatus Sulfopaludibacter sp.]
MLIRSRRDFFKDAVRSVTALGALGAMSKFGEMNALAQAQGTGYRAMVCIFLNGGNDGHNMVIPINTLQQDNTLYAKARAGLALNPLSLPNIYDGNDIYGLHPKLTEIAGLYAAGNAAVVANVGMLVKPFVDRNDYLHASSANLPNALFSHSDQSTQWQTAIPSGLGNTGWGGRMADNAQTANSAAVFPSVTATTGCQLFCTGSQTFPTTVPVGGDSLLNGTSGSPPRSNGVQTLLKFDNGMQLVQAANGILGRGVGYSNTLNALLAQANVPTVFPAGNLLGAQLQTVARMISIRKQLGITRQIFFCSLGGFDTHGGQLPVQDNLMQQLSQAVAAFYQSTKDLAVDQLVTTFTASEFGRTLTPNGNLGTDHAWGSHHFVIGTGQNSGGLLKGGKFYGQFPLLALGGANDANTRGTLIPTTSVDQYAWTMAQWFGVDPGSIGTVFPNISHFPNQNMGFLG